MALKTPFIVLFTMLLGGCALQASDAETDAEDVGQNESSLRRNALSSSEQQTALKLIDDICGDTWCEGDHNFAFDRLTCRTAPADSPSGGTCTLKLRIITREDAPRSYRRACTTSGFRGFESLVDTAESGYQSLDWDYYLTLSDCISQLEAALPR
jgi:hypothetical protein